VRIADRAGREQRGTLLMNHGLSGVATLAALAVVACCWSVSELSGAWSRTVPVVSSGAKPTTVGPVVASPRNTNYPSPITAGPPDTAPPALVAPPDPATPRVVAAPLGPTPLGPTPLGPTPLGPTPLDLSQRPGDNPLFTRELSLPHNPCTLPPYSANGALRFFTATVACLDRAWAPVLAAAGSPATPVRLQVLPVAGHDNPCGVESTVELAKYCDGTIYLSLRTGPDSDRLPMTGPGGYLEAIAHEFGHHLQRLSGVAGVGSRLRDAVGGTSAGGLVLTRRQELQASCLAGIAIADLAAHDSLTRAMRDQISTAAAARGDSPRRTGQPRYRGSRASNGNWFIRGYRSSQPRSCNTWLASPAEVS
jgi:hypothetical protein